MKVEMNKIYAQFNHLSYWDKKEILDLCTSYFNEGFMCGWDLNEKRIMEKLSYVSFPSYVDAKIALKKINKG